MSTGQSLAAQSGALGENFKLPEAFQPPTEPIKSRFIAPYVVFCHHNRTDEWAKLTSKFGQIVEGDMYLFEQDKITSLPKAKVGMLCYQQYWARTNAGGTEVLKTSLTELPDPFREHVEAVLLVYLEDRIVPANITFKTTKCPAAKTLSDALVEAASPTWGDKSPEHKESLIVAHPFGRFCGDMTLGPQRTGRGSGLPYRPTVCSIKPTGPSEWRLLKEFSEDEGTQKALNDASERYALRIAEMKSKL